MLLLELSLGFIVLSAPGALEVSVVEPVCVESTGPVDGAAGLLDPVSLRMSEGEEGRRIELSSALRPLGRRFDFIVLCLLQSHLQSLSCAIVPDDVATSRLVVDDELDTEPWSEVLLSVEVPAFGIA